MVGLKKRAQSVFCRLVSWNFVLFKPEPGYYKEGYFGVRLQNVFQVIEKPWLQHTSGHKYLGFKIQTLVPYQQKLMAMELLSTHHVGFIYSMMSILNLV